MEEDERIKKLHIILNELVKEFPPLGALDPMFDSHLPILATMVHASEWNSKTNIDLEDNKFFAIKTVTFTFPDGLVVIWQSEPTQSG